MTQVTKVVVKGARGPRGFASGALGAGSVDDETITDDPGAQYLILEKLGVAQNSIAKIAAMEPGGASPFLSLGERSGQFRWLSGDQSARVAADTLQGITIAPATDPTGASGCWARVWDGVIANPEWFGAVGNDSGTDSYAALQACLNVTKSLRLRPVTYYSSRGLLLPDNAIVWGGGVLQSGISVAHATDHLMRQRGVSGTSYASGAMLADFSLARSVNPTTPASSADDISQGHGIHMWMVSNPRIRHVYCYNNLIDFYLSEILSPDYRDIRGLRQTGGSGDRWYGLYVDGVANGGTFGGPSPNPSSTIIKPNMIAYSAVGQSYNYYLRDDLQDLWMVDPEAAGGHKQFFIDCNGGTAGDLHIVRPIADGYRTNAFHIKGTPLGSSINIVDAWMAPASGATSHGAHVDASHGVTLTGRGDFSLASGLRAVSANDCTGLDCRVRVANSQNPFHGTNVKGSSIVVLAHKSFAGGGGTFGEIITLIGGSRNKAAAFGTISTASSPQLWNAGIALDNTASGCTLDVTGVADGAATARLTIATSAVTTQGNVSGNVVINPGAGAML